MDQVKKEAEANEQLRKDWEQVQKSSEKFQERSAVGEEKLNRFGERVKGMSEDTAERFQAWRTKAGAASESFNRYTEEVEALKRMRKAAQSGFEKTSAGTDKAKTVFASLMDNTSKAFSRFGDEDKKAEKLKQWKAAKDFADAHAAAAEEAAKEAAENKYSASEAVFEVPFDDWANELKSLLTKHSITSPDGITIIGKTGVEHKLLFRDGVPELEGDAPSADEFPLRVAKAIGETEEHASSAEQAAGPGGGDALVVSKERTGAWDRFGASLGDMPFLSNVFENPLFDRLFGESEIAASLREMKEVDYAFELEDFAEDMEYIIAPHIIRSYLEGDADSLEKHCGDAAFAAVHAGIKVRKQQKLTLDPAILAGPAELELKGAQRMENGPPCFIWTFNMQQVNCLRDSTGEIIEGAVDDIRSVHYAMAVKRHPKPEEPGLEYPWEVTELAILGNFPCW